MKPLWLVAGCVLLAVCGAGCAKDKLEKRGFEMKGTKVMRVFKF